MGMADGFSSFSIVCLFLFYFILVLSQTSQNSLIILNIVFALFNT